jgi:hypothetical protein
VQTSEEGRYGLRAPRGWQTRDTAAHLARKLQSRAPRVFRERERG